MAVAGMQETVDGRKITGKKWGRRRCPVAGRRLHCPCPHLLPVIFLPRSLACHPCPLPSVAIMLRSNCFVSVVLGLLNTASVVVAWANDKADRATVAATIETSLTTADDQIRQFAFDGDAGTCFVSSQEPNADDHFTLKFEEPVTIRSITVTTGSPGGGDELESGALEVSADGKAFERLAMFTKGVAQATPDGRQVQAVRIAATTDVA
ncbi:MAG TPA: hypothetical protein VGX78_20660, partial [Pirellulales bacterium]|nr:hypothetical protein [Pirellulales bacterium]